MGWLHRVPAWCSAPSPSACTTGLPNKLTRRLGAIESARGADLFTIDRDASPEALEEKFRSEDELELTG